MPKRKSEPKLIKDVERPRDERLEPDAFFKTAVIKTYDYLTQTVRLASSVSELLFMRSMQGRAMMGHWAPSVENSQGPVICYPNTTPEEVCDALGYPVRKFHLRCQSIIDDIRTYFDKALNSIEDRRNGKITTINHCMKLVNERGEPLGGIELFRYGLVVNNPLNVLMGAYIGGCIDSAAWRARTEEKFNKEYDEKPPLRMHQGVCMGVRLEKAKQHGFTLNDLTKLGSTKRATLDDLIRKEIVKEKGHALYSAGYASGFIELQSGHGVSDDAAFLAVALTTGIEAAYGFLLVDAIDT